MLKYMASAILGCVLAGAAACSGGGKGSTPTPARTQTPTAAPVPDAPITIDQPADGAAVAVPIDVSGSANVFEGALQVAVVDASGQALCQHSVQATSGSGTRGTWSVAIAFPPADTPRPVALRAFDYSARDGQEENIVTRQVTLASALPAIVINSPKCNAVFGPTVAIEVSGTAEVFEAALTVEIRDRPDHPLLQQHVLASTGTGRGTWTASFDLSELPAGGGTYELAAYDLSARDGSVENEFTIPIMVTP